MPIIDAGSPWTRVEQVARSRPARVALLDSQGGKIDYETLYRWSERLVSVLKSNGCRPGAIVAVVLPPGVASVVTLLGVTSFCGCISLNPALHEEELRNELLELGVGTLICDTALTHDPGLGLTVIHASGNISDCNWEIVQQGTPQSPKSDLDTVLLLSTSGTTSRRKIVPLSRSNLAASIANLTTSVRLTDRDRLLLIAPLFHAQGIIAVLGQLAAGGSVVVSVGSAAASFGRWVRDFQPTWYTCGPTQHRAIVTELQTNPLQQPTSLRVVRSGGNTLGARLKRQMEVTLGVPVLDMYGLSETGMVAATDLNHAEKPGLKPGPGIDLAVMNSPGGVVNPGEEGEIVVRGPSVMSGYLNDPEANESAFWRDADAAPEARWFRTGDLGRIGSDGALNITGRIKEIINRGGQKVNPAEVDEVLMRHSAILDAATFAVSHTTLGEDVCCAVVVRDGREVTEQALKAFLGHSLAPFKVPARVYLLSDIPRGATGKPQRRLLRERFEAVIEKDRAAPSQITQRGNELEEAILAVWRRRLGCAVVDPEDSFWHLGGDSLGAELMLLELEKGLGKSLPTAAVQLFREEPTVATLAAIFSAEQLDRPRDNHETGDSSTAGRGLDLFFFRARGDLSGQYKTLSAALRSDRPLTLLSPEDSWYAAGDSVESAVSRAVEIIRLKQTSGPYLIGGFCAGGTLAFEAARQLQQAGDEAALFLIDAPMPGEPHPITEWKSYTRHARHLISAVCSGQIALRRLAGFLGHYAHRLIYVVVRGTAPLLWPLANARFIQWLYCKAEAGYLPVYNVPASSLPILQFAGKGRHSLWEEAISAWSKTTSATFRLVPLRGDHATLFSAHNAVVIAQEVRSYGGSAAGRDNCT